ncbi:MAG TPA: hypothetical protein VII48_09785, partial [Rhizomicrobium sp.]
MVEAFFSRAAKPLAGEIVWGVKKLFRWTLSLLLLASISKQRRGANGLVDTGPQRRGERHRRVAGSIRATL